MPVSNIDAAVFVVVPCYNEQDSLGATCRSLGFGLGKKAASPNSYLVVVDNGSTDKSREIARNIKAKSWDGLVIIGNEADRGYVPPRACGVEIAGKIAAELQLPEHRVLILQADADTEYDPGYVSFMRDGAFRNGLGVLIEAVSDWPTAFSTGNTDFIRFTESIDHEADEYCIRRMRRGC